MLLLSGFCCSDNGPQVTACVVSAADIGFHCVKYPDIRSYRSWEKGTDLSCISPDDLERFLKACKNKFVLPVDTCVIDLETSQFKCTTPEQKTYMFTYEQSDNFTCMNEQDTRRVKERCK